MKKLQKITDHDWKENLIFFYILAEGQQRPSYEDYHNAKLSILHSVFQVGGYLEEFLNLEMVNIKKKNAYSYNWKNIFFYCFSIIN